MRGVVFTVEGLSAFRAAEKLRNASIPLLFVKAKGKTGAEIGVDARMREKAFAILRGSCYTISGERATGLERLRRLAVRSIGLLCGMAVALCAVLFLQSRVLAVEVGGSGAYLEAEVRDALEACGVRTFSRPCGFSAAEAKILSLPRVQFCSVSFDGGILTVRVEVGEEPPSLTEGPLLCPVSGVVEELIVLRGTPAVAIGQQVKRGDLAVENAPYPSVCARIRVGYNVVREYPSDEAHAIAQAFLDFGELSSLKTSPCKGGTRVEGKAYAEASLNFERGG